MSGWYYLFHNFLELLINFLNIYILSYKILMKSNAYMWNILFQAMEAAYQRQHWTRTAISGSLVCSR